MDEPAKAIPIPMHSSFSERLADLVRWRPGRLAANALRGSAMFGIRLGVQAAYFLLLARALGPERFGAFSGVWVFCGFLGTFAGIGYPVLAFKAAALNPSRASAYVRDGLRTIAYTALPLAAILIVVVGWQFPAAPGPVVLALLAGSEIILTPALTLLASLHQADERLGRSHVIFASLWLCRIAGLLLLLAMDRLPSLPHVLVAHAIATAVATIMWYGLEGRIGADDRRMLQPGEHLQAREGLFFALSGAALIAYTELNQSMLLAMTGAVAAGLIAVAYKVVAAISAPLTAICQAVSPRLVVAAHQGRASLRKLLLALAWPLALYALLSTIAILAVSTVIPFVFGQDYADAVRLARQLCVLPAFSALRLLATYALMALSNQKRRVAAELASLTLGLVLNVYLIGRAGLEGAVIALLLTEALTAAILATVAWHASTPTPASMEAEFHE